MLASRSSFAVCSSHASKACGVRPDRHAMKASRGPAVPMVGRQLASSTMYSARCSWSLAACELFVDLTTTAPAPARNAQRTPSASIRCSAEPAMRGFFRSMRPIVTLLEGMKRLVHVEFEFFDDRSSILHGFVDDLLHLVRRGGNRRRPDFSIIFWNSSDLMMGTSLLFSRSMIGSGA